ncbi:hypothetical protein ELK24_25755 [Salmonella enterica]|nr:hypothetical protein [Salmonella enterica]ECE6544595.1 hypothetical protein [Salmonella enterica subsp. enterica]EDN4789230.1 glycosyltransferase family 2 protein [Salmonella enterica subsp. enterica]
MQKNFLSLQNIFFDNSSSGKQKLYSSHLSNKIKTSDHTIIFRRRSTLTLCSAAQIFPNHHYISNTIVKKINLRIGELKGSIKLLVYFVDGIEAETLELNETLTSGSEIITPSIKLKNETGYFYIKIISLEHNTRINNIAWGINDTPSALFDCNILIGITTFKRDEQLHKNLRKISQCSYLNQLNIDVMIVDNGRSIDLSEYCYPFLYTVQNNSGGTGGFMRSLCYAKKNNYSHTLFMDDDIEVETEMLYRAIIFSFLTTNPTTTGLMMMKKSNPTTVWEQGAFIDKNRIYHGFSYNFCLNIENKKNLLSLHKNRSSDFVGWWGCIVPTKLAPILPYMFIKNDDIISGLILKKQNVPLITLPNAMVWHEDFNKKPYTWQHYYDIRNGIMIRHFENLKTNKMKIILSLGKILLKALISGDYYCSEIILLSFNDALNPSDNYFKNITKLKEKHKKIMSHFPLDDISNRISSIERKQNKRKDLFFSLVSLFGTMNPFSHNFDDDGRRLSIPLNSNIFFHSYRFKTVIFYDPYTFTGYECTKSIQKVLFFLIKFSKLSLHYMLLGKKISGQKFIVNQHYWNSEFEDVIRINSK